MIYLETICIKINLMKRKRKRKRKEKAEKARKTRKIIMLIPISKNRLITLPINKVTPNQKVLRYNQILMKKEILSVLSIKMQVNFQTTKGL